MQFLLNFFGTKKTKTIGIDETIGGSNHDSEKNSDVGIFNFTLF